MSQSAAVYLTAAPTFLVSDVASTAVWYEEHLGFRAEFFPRAQPYVYASLRRDGIEIMLLGQENYLKPEISRPGGAWDAYIRVRGVHRLYEQVRQRTQVHSDLVQRSYGDWEFEIRDPNGYVVVFGELTQQNS